jgi:hypothetical protein
VSAGRHVDKDQEQQGPRGRMLRCVGGHAERGHGNGVRVRDAAMHLESRREEVERRDPHRGIQPRCMTEVRGKSADAGLKYGCHPCAAIYRWPSKSRTRWIVALTATPAARPKLAMEEAYHGDK